MADSTIEVARAADPSLVVPLAESADVPISGPGPGANSGPSLSSRAARGFAWAIGFMVFARLIGLFGQFVLATLLSAEDFGTVAVAQSIATFVAIVQMAGLPEILVQRQQFFSVWASPAFWMALALGGVTALLLAALGPLAAWWNNNPALTWIMIIIGAQCLVSSLQVVPTATMQVGLRLRAITALNMLQSVGGIVITVALAAIGAGAFSLAIGPLTASLIVLVAMWSLARPRIRRSPQLGRWRYLWGNSALLLATGVIGNVVSQGAIFLLGLAHSERTVGLFSWAWMLSLQTVVLITGSLNVVLFPTLSKLQHDPPRMLAAFFRAARMIALLGVPACLLQAACATWFIDLVFVDRWDDAAPAAVLLSIGLAFGILGGLPATLLKANGMIQRLFWITVGYAVLYVVMGSVAVFGHASINRLFHTDMNAATVTAWAILIASAITGPVSCYLVVRPLGGRKRDVLNLFGPALLLAGAIAIIAHRAAGLLPVEPDAPRLGLATRLGIVVLMMGAMYVPLAKIVLREPFRELIERVREVLKRRHRPA